MAFSIRDFVLPPNQRRTLDELSDSLDLTRGDTRSKQSAFWSMLVLSAVIASAGVLADSTATVIGAMIIAPLSTPIMGTALSLVRRQDARRSAAYVLLGGLSVVMLGAFVTLITPGSPDLLSNAQVTGRTSPGLLDLTAAIATGLAGAIGMSRKDVAAVMPGVAIAISLVPPLAVVGICIAEGNLTFAAGALLLFLSNVVAMIIGGTFIFAALGYAMKGHEGFGWAAEGDRTGVGANRRARLILGTFLVVVFIPLAANTALVALLHTYQARVEQAGQEWVQGIPGAEVMGVTTSPEGFVLRIRTPGTPPSVTILQQRLAGRIPSQFSVRVDTTYGVSNQLGRLGN